MSSAREFSHRALSRRHFLHGMGVVAGSGTLAFFLSACGSNSSSSTANPTAAPAANPTKPASKPAPTTAPAAAPTATTAPVAQTAAGGLEKNFDIHLVQWSSFVAEADKELKRQAAEFGQKNGGKVTIDIVNGNDLQAKTSAAVQSKSGPDILQMEFNWPHLYAEACLDLSAEAEALSKQFGGYYDFMTSYCKVGSTWRAVPYTVVSNAWTYRTDWLSEATGSDKFPDTLQGLLDVGKKLKAKGHPIGEALGHAYGDANTMWYGTLWNFGGHEVDKDGKTVTINSPETKNALEWTAEFWKDALDPTGLSWDDSSNNRAYLAQTISASQNGASIYIVSGQKYPDIFKNTNNAVEPKGPKSDLPGYEIQLNFEHAVTTWSKYPNAAKQFITWIMQPEQYSKWLGVSKGYNVGVLHHYDDDPVWKTDPKLQPFREAMKASLWPGYPAAPGRPAAEALSKYIVVDMFAKVCQGTAPKDAMTWAEQQLKPIYGG